MFLVARDSRTGLRILSEVINVKDRFGSGKIQTGKIGLIERDEGGETSGKEALVSCYDDPNVGQ